MAATPRHRPSSSELSSSTTQRPHDMSHDRSSYHPRVIPNIMIWRLLSPILSLWGLYWFSSSFFLAKRSLTQTSSCNEAHQLLRHYLDLSPLEIQQMVHLGLILPASSFREGCWMPRRADSIILLVVDALRFDFAQHRLPLSIGSRLDLKHYFTNTSSNTASTNHHNSNSVKDPHSYNLRSQLLQFVADPPTVTMQRLKGLTTGGLPTFADISANMGGAVVDEDSWIEQLRTSPFSFRGMDHPSKLGFVGDDTWVDLFPTQFQYSYPYPSFNTRDLNTVDNGCLQHLPTLLRKIQTRKSPEYNHTTDTTLGRENVVSTHPVNEQGKESDQLEVVVAHFLGVDHVGHTYGPHNIHMDEKLHQVDQALGVVLDRLDQEHTSCHICFIFGDHGMTEDGNHGGGTDNEVNAALFVHVSPGCGTTTVVSMNQPPSSSSHKDTTMAATNNEDSLVQEISSLLLTDVIGSYGEAAYASIHQIDLVATVSVLLGLPIPFANLGSLVPSLIPNSTAAQIATSLALNAAQVWRYFSVYSKTAQKLPNLSELHQRLQEAVSAYQHALMASSSTTTGDPEADIHLRFLHHHIHDVTLYHKAAALFKIFLLEATELGKRVWTRFDHTGMIMGGIILSTGLVLATWGLLSTEEEEGKNVEGAATQRIRYFQPILDAPLDIGLTILFMAFHCVVLSFSNSYIETERHIVIFMMAVLGLVIYMRHGTNMARSSGVQNKLMTRSSNMSSSRHKKAALNAILIPMAARLGELVVSGHGLDPSLQVHFAHNAVVFLSCLIIVGIIRWKLQNTKIAPSVIHLWMDEASLVTIAASWWEKHLPDPNRNGFLCCRLAYLLLTVGLVLSILRLLKAESTNSSVEGRVADRTVTIVCKLLMAIMAVTGPSTAASVLLFLIQTFSFWFLIQPSSGSPRNNSLFAPVAAAIWRLIIRNIFFATNHACSFSRLQYSAAFVATIEFHFVMSGSALFLNTFGWELCGNLMMLMFSRLTQRPNLWKWYGWYQLLETFCSVISVSLLRRHLMVWAVFAPRFLFVAIFLILNVIGQILVYVVGASTKR